MARIVLGSYLFRYPLGGNISCVLQYLVGLEDLGHEVYFVEQSGYDQSCFDPVRRVMTNDPRTGIDIVTAVLSRFGLERSWCYVDSDGGYRGMSRPDVEDVFRTADLYIEMGTGEAWAEEASWAASSALFDGEPGFSQIWMCNRLAQGDGPAEYDHYFTVGRNVATGRSSVPDCGVAWHPMFHPVVTRLFSRTPPSADAPFTTVMNWHSHADVDFDGRTYGQKDREFAKFVDLPERTPRTLQLAIGGDAPRDTLCRAGWQLVDGHDATRTLDEYAMYIESSAGEFSVCKEGYVATRTAWFSDRSAAYLASGRPVIQQDTGFGDHLPCGTGLFAVASVDEAAEAIHAISADPAIHGRGARAIAEEYLEATIVLGEVLATIGL